MITISPNWASKTSQHRVNTSTTNYMNTQPLRVGTDSFQKSKSSPHFAGGLDDVIGLEKEKETIREQFIGSLKDSLDPSSADHTDVEAQQTGGLLLHGPAGTGKSYLAQKTAEEIGAKERDRNFRLVTILPEERASHLVGITESVLSDKFTEAAKAPRSIIFIDEFDSLASKQHPNGSIDPHQPNIRAAMLLQLENAPARGITVIGTSNKHPDELDPAIVRAGRMTVKREIKSIVQETRKGIFKKVIKETLKSGADFSFSDRQLEKLAKDAKDRSPADIVSIVKMAANKARYKKEKLDMKHLEAVMKDEFNLNISEMPIEAPREVHRTAQYEPPQRVGMFGKKSSSHSKTESFLAGAFDAINLESLGAFGDFDADDMTSDRNPISRAAGAVVGAVSELWPF